MRDHLRLIVNTHTHTIEADFTTANNTVTLSLFAFVWCMIAYGCAQQVVLVCQDYIISISSYPWLLIVLKIYSPGGRVH